VTGLGVLIGVISFGDLCDVSFAAPVDDIADEDIGDCFSGAVGDELGDASFRANLGDDIGEDIGEGLSGKNNGEELGDVSFEAGLAGDLGDSATGCASAWAAKGPTRSKLSSAVCGLATATADDEPFVATGSASGSRLGLPRLARCGRVSTASSANTSSPVAICLDFGSFFLFANVLASSSHTSVLGICAAFPSAVVG